MTNGSTEFDASSFLVCRVAMPATTGYCRSLRSTHGILSVYRTLFDLNGCQIRIEHVREISRRGGRIRLITTSGVSDFTVESPLGNFPDPSMAALAAEVMQAVISGNLARAVLVSARLRAIRRFYW